MYISLLFFFFHFIYYHFIFSYCHLSPFLFLLEFLLAASCFVLNRSNFFTFLPSPPFGLHTVSFKSSVDFFCSVTFLNPQSCFLFPACPFVCFSVPPSRLCILVPSSVVVAFLRCQELCDRRFTNASEALKG